jgi:AcrR family transcriptional regulator
MAIDKQEVIRLYESGIVPGEIAKRFDVTPGAISHILTRANIARRMGKVRVLKEKTGERRRAFFRAQYDQAIELYHDGYEISEIMAETGLAKSTLTNYFSTHKIKRNTRAQLDRYKRALVHAAECLNVTVEELLQNS